MVILNVIHYCQKDLESISYIPVLLFVFFCLVFQRHFIQLNNLSAECCNFEWQNGQAWNG
jgi:hypothetical protein